MNKKLELPQYKVRQKKAEVWADIKGSPLRLSDELYAKTIRLVNEPAGLMAAMVLDESKRLRRRLNILILLGWALHVLALGVTIVAIISWSYLPFILAVGIELFWYFVISRRQTTTNIELGATTEVFCEMMGVRPCIPLACDRSGAPEVRRERCGQLCVFV